MIAEIIITLILMIPLYGILLWTFFNPEESLLFGKRWMYEEEPEFSPRVIRYTKFASLFTMIGTPFVLLFLFFKTDLFGLALMGFLLTFVIGALFIFSASGKA